MTMPPVRSLSRRFVALRERLAEVGRRTPVDEPPLTSPDWHRVADLHVLLQPGVDVQVQPLRGARWHVLSSPLDGQQLRLDERHWRFLSACDGQVATDALWQAQLQRHGDDALTQPEVIVLLARAHNAQMIEADARPDATRAQAARRARRRRQQRLNANPLSFRLATVPVDAFLTRTLPWVRPLTTGRAQVLGWLLVLLAAACALPWLPEIAAEARRLEGQPRTLLWLWLALPPLKLLHELAHGWTLKARGGEVPRLGLALNCLTPMPFVDASAANALPQGRDRAAVAAAGMLVDALAGAAAFLAFTQLGDGAWREFALTLMLTATVSTLALNGNPLLPFDGHHVACDLLQLPELGPRSTRWWAAQAARVAGLKPDASTPVPARGEAPWLALFAPLSLAWRIGGLAALAWLADSWHPALGLVVAGLAIWTLLLRPCRQAWRWVAAAPQPLARARLAALFGLLGLGMAGSAVALPLAERASAMAVVWLPEDARLRLPRAARLERLLAASGSQVQPGQRLAVLVDEQLDADLAQAEAERDAADLALRQGFDHDALAAGAAATRLERLTQHVADLEAQRAALMLQARVAGRLSWPQGSADVGRWLPQGHEIGLVLPEASRTLRVALPAARLPLAARGEAPAGLVGLQAQVQLAGESRTRRATVRWVQPQAVTRLPARSLGSAGGGPIPVRTDDPDGLEAVAAQVLLDLALDPDPSADATPLTPGVRARVTIEFGQATLAERLQAAVSAAWLRLQGGRA